MRSILISIFIAAAGLCFGCQSTATSAAGDSGLTVSQPDHGTNDAKAPQDSMVTEVSNYPDTQTQQSQDPGMAVVEDQGTSSTVDSGQSADTTTGNQDQGSVKTEVDLATLDLHGTLPPVALAVPEFTATNFDGTPRGQTDLIGQPTVLWFFPAAQTAG